MTATLKFLGVHGLGDHRQSPWREEWEKAIRDNFPMQGEIGLDFHFLTYDDVFEDVDISPWEAAKAVWKLLRSGVSSIWRRTRRRGAMSDVSHWLKWYAGYVVAWVEDREFQEKTRAKLLNRLLETKPDVLLAHSLGSLVTYNALSHEDAATRALRQILKKMAYVTLGAQIGNPFVVRNLTPGRIERLDVQRWYHLYNAEDDIFTAPIQIWDADNFKQVETYFDIDGFADHDAAEYLSHPATVQQVWETLALWAQEIAAPEPGVPRRRAFIPVFAEPDVAEKRPPRRQALLIGINDYPNPEDRLDGCVNDTFLISSVLQECGFEAEDIRLCLNDRATADGILERTVWLLDNPQPDDELVFYYSGHGARLPTYGEGDQVDRMDETLVPYDFNWSQETCITDDLIFSLYGQLPYETKLVMIFDCCHSGGIHRAGSLKMRGLNPPDDIRHRALRWNQELRMWEPRELRKLNEDFSAETEINKRFFGANGATTRLGRASSIRSLSQAAYEDQKRKRKGRPLGPYLPVIFEACKEDEYAYEYRHGVVSYGAFSYALATTLRREKTITFNTLLKEVGKTLISIGFVQAPQILGPEKILNAKVPWSGNP